MSDKDMKDFIRIVGKWTADHFQPGVVLPADSGVPLADIYRAGEMFLADSLHFFKDLCNESPWWQERVARQKARLGVLGRPTNPDEFMKYMKERQSLRDRQELLSLLRDLRAERSALEREFAVRAEELARRD